MISINENLKNIEAKLYDKDNNFVGMVNEYQLRDIQVQIMKQKVEGYYIEFDNKKIKINIFGRLEKPCIGFTDISYNLTKQLLKF